VPSSRQRQGWLLCNDGARQASRTAARMNSVSTILSRMFGLPFPFNATLRERAE